MVQLDGEHRRHLHLLFFFFAGLVEADLQCWEAVAVVAVVVAAEQPEDGSDRLKERFATRNGRDLNLDGEVEDAS